MATSNAYVDVVRAALGKPLRLVGFGLLGGLAGCASGIDLADEACARHRATVASFADCLRTNHATLASGMPDQRDLATLYLAQAEFLASQVAARKGTDAEAMLALAYFRNTLAAEGQKRQQATIDRYVKAMEASASQSGSGSGSGSSSGGGSGFSSGRGYPAYPVRSR